MDFPLDAGTDAHVSAGRRLSNCETGVKLMGDLGRFKEKACSRARRGGDAFEPGRRGGLLPAPLPLRQFLPGRGQGLQSGEMVNKL